MNPRPEYMHCVLRETRPGEGKVAWCGRRIEGLSWHFVDAQHAALNGAQEGRLVACPECRDAIALALNNGHDAPPTPAAGPWVLASERLPAKKDMVLVHCGDGEFRTAAWGRYGDGWYFQDDNLGLEHEVLRWAEVKP